MCFLLIFFHCKITRRIFACRNTYRKKIGFTYSLESLSNAEWNSNIEIFRCIIIVVTYFQSDEKLIGRDECRQRRRGKSASVISSLKCAWNERHIFQWDITREPNTTLMPTKWYIQSLFTLRLFWGVTRDDYGALQIFHGQTSKKKIETHLSACTSRAGRVAKQLTTRRIEDECGRKRLSIVTLVIRTCTNPWRVPYNAVKNISFSTGVRSITVYRRTYLYASANLFIG